jgi:uncharacterized DUF497 family protein
VKIEFDPAKSARNAEERGLPFELTAELDWDVARVRLDDRRDYGEQRYFAWFRCPEGSTRFVTALAATRAGSSVFARRTNERSRPMRRPLADKDGDIRELTAEDMRLFKPIAEVDIGMVEAM